MLSSFLFRCLKKKQKTTLLRVTCRRGQPQGCAVVQGDSFDGNRVELIFTATAEINGLELGTVTRIDQTYATIFVVKGCSNVIHLTLAFIATGK